MIQVNLIPDVKREFIRTQRLRNATISIAVVVGLAAIGVVAVLGVILAGQALHVAISRGKVDENFKKLQQVENGESLLTLQNQLASIDSQHANKSKDSRLFNIITAISPLAPDDVKISSVHLEPSSNTLTIQGTAANGYAATDVFKKTILNTKITYDVNGNTTTVKLTDDVTIPGTSYGEDASGAKVLRFELSFVYPEDLFKNTANNIQIITPAAQTDVTDSKLRVSDSLFGAQAKDIKESN